MANQALSPQTVSDIANYVPWMLRAQRTPPCHLLSQSLCRSFVERYPIQPKSFLTIFHFYTATLDVQMLVPKKCACIPHLHSHCQVHSCAAKRNLSCPRLIPPSQNKQILCSVS